MGSDNPRFNISAPALERSPVGVLEPSAKASTAVGRHWYTWLASPLWLVLLLAVIIRIWLTVRTHGTLDGDEALLGIQAEHILQGARPIYFYGIPYFGSLEAYLAALLFAVFGPSVAALRAETTAIFARAGRRYLVAGNVIRQSGGSTSLRPEMVRHGGGASSRPASPL